MVDKCPICLDDMFIDLGVSVPCGHCFHRSCFSKLKRQTEPNENGRRRPSCPCCNQKIKSFTNLYLTIPHLPLALAEERKKLEECLANIQTESSVLEKRLERKVKKLIQKENSVLERRLGRKVEECLGYTQMEKSSLGDTVFAFVKNIIGAVIFVAVIKEGLPFTASVLGAFYALASGIARVVFNLTEAGLNHVFPT